jgi:hypothetical protein
MDNIHEKDFKMELFVGTSIFSLVYAVIGLFLVINYIRHRSKHQASESWIPVEGKVIRSWVREDYSTDSEGDSTTTYYPEVEYVYSFLGKEYQGNQIAFGPKVGGSRSRAEKIIAKYSGGDSLTVYYDPSKPEDSVLERVLSKTSLVYGLLCLVVAVITVVIRL